MAATAAAAASATELSPHQRQACTSPPVGLPSHALTSGGCLVESNSASMSRAMDLSIGNHLSASLKQQQQQQQQHQSSGQNPGSAAGVGAPCCGDAVSGGSSSSCGSSSSNGGSAPSTPSATPTPSGATPTPTNMTATTGDGEKKYSCDYCDYTSSWPSHLRLHRMRHTGEKPYACQECNFQTAWVGDLKRHQRVHTGERPYACQFCDFATAQKGNLNTHMRRYHSKNSSTSPSPGPPNLVHPALTVGLLSSLSSGGSLQVPDHPVDPSSLFHQMTSHFPLAALAQNPVLAPRSPPGATGKQSPR